MSEIFTRQGVSFPYELEKRIFKSFSNGEEKRRIEFRIAVLSNEVNSFVNNLANERDGLALSSTSYENKGAITIVTVAYGEEAFSEDEAITYYTMSNGVLSFHIRQWIQNTPAAIRAFCLNCRHGYGYASDEVSVSCSPELGAERVQVEATFTPKNQVTDENDDFEEPETPPEENPDEEPEQQTQEEGTSIQMTSNQAVIPVPVRNYVNKVIGQQKADRLISFCNRVESGELRWIEANEFGEGKPKTAGWISTAAEINPLNIQVKSFSTKEYPQDEVSKCISAMRSIPSAVVPQTRVTITTKITSADKLSLSMAASKMDKVGQESESISSGDFSLNAPKPTIKANGYEFEGKTVWVNEGCSFDISTVEEKTSLSGKKFYVGTMSESWSSMTTIIEDGADNEAGSQA